VPLLETRKPGRQFTGRLHIGLHGCVDVCPGMQSTRRMTCAGFTKDIDFNAIQSHQLKELRHGGDSLSEGSSARRDERKSALGY